MLASNSLELSLVGVNLQDLSYLDRVAPNMLDLLKVDFSQNMLESIDWLDQFKQLKSIRAVRCFIRYVNLYLPRLQELDLRNNFIERMPSLRNMPNMQAIYLKANNMNELNLDFSSLNYANMVNIDVRNNKNLTVSVAELRELGRKLHKFKQLRFFNMEHKNLDLRSEEYKD